MPCPALLSSWQPHIASATTGSATNWAPTGASSFSAPPAFFWNLQFFEQKIWEESTPPIKSWTWRCGYQVCILLPCRFTGIGPPKAKKHTTQKKKRRKTVRSLRLGWKVVNHQDATAASSSPHLVVHSTLAQIVDPALASALRTLCTLPSAQTWRSDTSCNSRLA